MEGKVPQDGDEVLVERQDGVLTLVLNRPQVRNAISREMVPVLTRIVLDAKCDPSVRCVLLRGAGDHFTAGGDVAGFRETLELSPAERRAQFRVRLDRAKEMVLAFANFDKPIVAACRGGIAGAGLMLTLTADLVLADDTATFVFAHQRMALIPDGGVSWLLPRVVGLRQAKRLLLTAAQVSGPEALRLGLITALHEASELDEAVEKAVRSLARAPQLATRTAKRLLDHSLSTAASDQLDAERDGIVDCVGDPDFPEAVGAFIGKRPARFPSAS
jgi:2-(1,2-epoxy-1,2-dihydrophenyl)acetyl-CoA isomerase